MPSFHLCPLSLPALLLAATAAFANPYTGTVKTMDLERRNLTVVISGKPEVFYVRKDAKMLVNGKSGEFRDLFVTMEIVVSCEPKTRIIAQLIAKDAPPPAPPAPPAPPPPPELDPRSFRVGQVGVLGRSIKVLQVIDKSNVRVSSAGEDFWIKGLSTEGMVDDKSYSLDSWLQATGTKQYRTVLGATKTVFLLEPTPEVKPKPPELPPPDTYTGKIDLFNHDHSRMLVWRRTEPPVAVTIPKDGVQISIDGKPAKALDLAFGQEVTVVCEPGTLRAVRVQSLLAGDKK